MGSGIAQHFAGHGHTVILYDLDNTLLEKARRAIESDWQKGIEKGKLRPEDMEAGLSRLHFTTSPEACRAGLIIEAIVEKLEAKISLFQRLAAINDPDTILASNTSSLSIKQIAAALPNPERVVGLHFFNPATLMKLVEVVVTETNPPQLVDKLRKLCADTGKVPVVCKDSPGFIVNRVARPFYIESLRMAEEGQLELATIDKLMENAGFRMGPFRLMDLIGNDINFAVSQSVYEQLGRPERLRPSPIQQQKVEKGELGKKTGKGYFDWSN